MIAIILISVFLAFLAALGAFILLVISIMHYGDEFKELMEEIEEENFNN